MQHLDQNKQTIRALYDDVLSEHRLERLRDLIAPSFPGGPGGFEAIVGALLAAFPDIRYTVTDLVADGDRVAVRWEWSGTHAAPFRGHAATGARITDTGMAIYTLADALVTGVVLETDRLGFLQQLGVVPANTAPRAAPPVLDPQRAPTGVYLIDTFSVPAPARAEFEAAMRRNRAHIRTLEGFRGDAVLVRKQGDAFDIATIAAWESPVAIAHAKEQVAAFYRRIGFDMPAAIARWGVQMQRTICEAPTELQ